MVGDESYEDKLVDEPSEAPPPLAFFTRESPPVFRSLAPLAQTTPLGCDSTFQSNFADEPVMRSIGGNDMDEVDMEVSRPWSNSFGFGGANSFASNYPHQSFYGGGKGLDGGLFTGETMNSKGKILGFDRVSLNMSLVSDDAPSATKQTMIHLSPVPVYYEKYTSFFSTSHPQELLNDLNDMFYACPEVDYTFKPQKNKVATISLFLIQIRCAIVHAVAHYPHGQSGHVIYTTIVTVV